MERVKCSVFVWTLLSCSALYAQTGHVVHGVGAVNQSMAGAGTALPLDATSALFWNPASITDLKSSEVDVNADLGLIDAEVSSTLDPNTLAPGLPARALAGSSRTTAQKAFLGSIAWVHVAKDKKWAYGLLAAEIGGFSFNYKNNGRNPITTPQPPIGLGVGEIFTNYTLIQVAPSVAYRINDHLSAGIALDFDVSSLKSNPFPFTSPDDANGDGFPTFPQSNRARSVGGGVQGGLYDKIGAWQLGFSVKSTQWFKGFNFDSRNELGAPRSFKFNLNYPMIVTAGIGYSSVKRVNWAADIRYIDYQDTKGFDQGGFDPLTGAVKGLGWKSIWVFATGVQVRVSDRLSIRAGYGLNENPIKQKDTFFDLGSPLITQQQANAGFSYRFNQDMNVSFAYHHAFENSIRGQFQSPQGPVSGSSVQSTFGADIFVLSLSRQFF